MVPDRGFPCNNATDGVVIAAAFLADFGLGVVTALAIIAREVPQEVSDFRAAALRLLAQQGPFSAT